MRLLAAEGDTWGISSRAFIGAYVIAALVLTAVTLFVRWRLRAGHGLERELDTCEVAYLVGGPRRTIATAVAGLHADGAIAAADGELRVSGSPRLMRTPLDHAVYDAIQRGVATTAWRLRTSDDVRRAVDEVRDRLARDDLAVGPVHRAQARLAVLPLAILLPVGIARLVAGLQDERPVGYLLVILVVLAFVALVLSRRPPRALRSGTAAVKAVRSRSGHLDPSMSPAWTTYGATGAALGVALFGTDALLSIDPDFGDAAALHPLLSSGTSVWGPSSSSGSSGVYTCSTGGCSGGGDGGGGCGGGGCGG
jgi:uncharacterized protein (TIGR04222 family)